MSAKINPARYRQKRQKNRAVIALGSNIRPQYHINKAYDILNHNYRVLNRSSLHHTQALEVPASQPDFINCGCLLETDSSLHELDSQLKQIEGQLGRPPNSSEQPRCMDMDIIGWNGAVIHKDVYVRSFVREILLELLPELAPLFIISADDAATGTDKKKSKKT